MKKVETTALDEKDNEIVQIFVELGMPQGIAKTLVFVSQVDQWLATDIENATKLRQPNVSTIMTEFEKNGWISKELLKKDKGKGRPVYLYKLKKPVSEIIKNFKEEKLQEIETLKKNLDQLDTNQLASLFNH